MQLDCGLDSRILGCVGEGRDFSGRGRKGGPRKRVLDWVSDPLWSGFGKANFSSKCATRIPAWIFFGLGAVATTHTFLSFSLEPIELLQSVWWGNRDLKGEEGLFQSKRALCSCGDMGQLRIPWRA
jgi:hypothetical protein